MADITKQSILSTIIVIVGISGDLARRRLLPALRNIAVEGMLPEHFRIVGISRHKRRITDLLPAGDKRVFRNKIETLQIDLSDKKARHKLAVRLKKIEQGFGSKTQTLFYLSVPPQTMQPVIEALGGGGMLGRNSKLLVEKPFGYDLSSAKRLMLCLNKYFEEQQLYLIDHYLAKEMVQNLVIFRGSNSLIMGTWNKDFIEQIEVSAYESIGVEGRSSFYEQTGAMRDVLQSHLLQLAALVLMDLPLQHEWRDIPLARLRALKLLELVKPVGHSVARGQYQGYREAVGNPNSSIETFVSLRLHSKDRRWGGVPIILTAGKATGIKYTEVRIRYRQGAATHTNELVMRIQPREGLVLQVWVKRPGYGPELSGLPLELSYENHFSSSIDDYQRIFVDAIQSHQALFTTSQEVLTCWRLVNPILKLWSASAKGLFIYPQGQIPNLS